MKTWKVVVFNDDIVVDLFMDEAMTEKGLEKKYKSEFKKYIKLGYSWHMEEVE